MAEVVSLDGHRQNRVDSLDLFEELWKFGTRAREWPPRSPGELVGFYLDQRVRGEEIVLPFSVFALAWAFMATDSRDRWPDYTLHDFVTAIAACPPVLASFSNTLRQAAEAMTEALEAVS